MSIIQKVPFQCAEVGRTVAIAQLVELVSGIGDDEANPIVLGMDCTLAKGCPKAERCPLQSIAAAEL